MTKIITFGVFDYLHLGHLRLFENCKKYGDYLIVAVQNEKFILKYKPEAQCLYTTEERVEMLTALRVVDEVVVYDSVGIEFLQNIDFDVLALGEDHIGERFTIIENWCFDNHKKVIRLKRTPGISSTVIRRNVQK